MNKLFFKLFVKDYENVQDPSVRKRYGTLAGALGIATNALLSGFKITLGWITGSIAIIADGINNLTDISSSVITLIGFKLSAMPEDQEHPYGHARIEYVTGLIISMLVILVGVQLLIASGKKVLSPDLPQFSMVAVIILLVSIAIKLWQASFYRQAGKAIGSLALMASSADSKADAAATGAVLLSVIAGRYLSIPLDGIAGCLVAGFILWTGIRLVKETSSPLLGEQADPELVNTIAQLTRSFPGVLGIHDLVVHNYGPGKIFASLHIEVDADADVMASHDLVDDVEQALSETLQIHLVAHMDPIRIHDPLLDELRIKIEKLIEPIEGASSIHDLRMVPGYARTKIVFDLVLLPGCNSKEEDIRDVLQKGVHEINPNYFITITFDKAYTLPPS